MFHLFSECSWGWISLNSLSMFALLRRLTFVSSKQTISASSQIKCVPTAWLIKLRRLNDSFIQVNVAKPERVCGKYGCRFPTNPDLFFPIKWKTSIDIPINGTLEYKSSYVFIRNIAIKFNTKLFEKHPWDFVFII